MISKFTIVILLLSLFLCGCPPPPNIKFQSPPENKYHDENFELWFEGWSYMGVGKGAGYELTLYACFKILAEEGDWRVHPKNIEVLLEGRVMKAVPYKGPWYSNTLIPQKQYRFVRRFSYGPPLDMPPFSTNDTINEPVLEIMLNGFLYFNNNPVFIDTVKATDVTAKYYMEFPLR